MSVDDMPVPMLSTGVPSTLGNWHALCVATFGADSSATAFIKAKLDAQGANMAVLADEGQLVTALIQMHVVGTEGRS
jgi:hypothetical protein